MVDKTPTLNLTKYIETRFFGARPHIRNRRVPVALIADARHEAGRSLEDIMFDYTLTEAEVMAALLYYAEHKTAIDTQEAAYRAVTPEEWIQYGEDALLRLRTGSARSIF